MSTFPDPKRPKEIIGALTEARDTARLRLHLLSETAKERWHGLETQLEELQLRLGQEQGRVSETMAQNVSQLTRKIQEFWSEHPAPELDTAAGGLAHESATCTPDDSLDDAARLMKEHDCGAIPVVNDAGTLLGLVTDRDICMAAHSSGRPLSSMTVQSAMSRDIARVSSDEPLEDVMQLMRAKRVRRIPVMEEGKLAGIIALADVVHYLEADGGFSKAAAQSLSHVLADISRPNSAGNGEQSRLETS